MVYGGCDENRTRMFLRDRKMGQNHCPTHPNIKFLLRTLTHSTLTQNRTETIWVETICTIHYAIRVF